MNAEAEAFAGFTSVEQTRSSLLAQGYVAESGLGTCVFLALAMGKPLLLEGAAGVGKTEVAKVLAAALETTLIRIQCYEGLDVHHAVYEWNYPRQLLELQRRGALHEDGPSQERDIFSEDFLLRRPILQAIDQSHERSPVLLIDELDRADEEFESYLLELLSDFQVTIPELGTLRARHRPVVILTSNRTRELHDALKRRCAYYWVDYPTVDKELEIVGIKRPQVPAKLAKQLVAFVQRLRQQELQKAPGVAETLEWGQALMKLGVRELSSETLEGAWGFLLKAQEDIDRVRAMAPQLLQELSA
ncbi:MAG: MoxR family ATPase [Myxococcales bacterium]|nr:MoxR family ATPase [Myxococcales bacterium]